MAIDAADLGALAAPFRTDPGGSVLLFDVDGTLAPIVEDPAAARPAASAVERLLALAVDYRAVGAVSGRPVDFLAAHLPSPLVLSGLYGLESVVGGQRVHHPEADRWRPVVIRATELASSEGPRGMVVEGKGLSLTVHYRTRPELEDDVLAWAVATGERLGLEVRPAKMSVELHPPIESDKGTAVEELAAGARGVLYAGDDVGDIPAFDALDRLAAIGVHTARVVVGSAEVPPALVERADLVLPGVEAIVDLLAALAPEPS